jgi:predicted nucleic acid-binding protein
LPAPDILIAAHALQAGATVLTLDAHFSAIPGLRVIDRLS